MRIKVKKVKNIICSPLDNKEGMVLVLSLMVLVILSLLAGFATQVSNTEISIAANDEIFLHNFYAGEAVCVEAGVQLKAIPDANLVVSAIPTTWGPGNTYPWLEPARTSDADPDGDGEPGMDLASQANWPSPTVAPQTTALPAIVPAGSGAPDRIQYAAQFTGQVGNLDVTLPPVYAYSLYGMYDVNRGAGKAYHGKIMLTMGFTRTVDP